MKTTHPIKITIQEVANTLGWNYEDARAVRNRKSPQKRYKTYIACEQKLIQAKKKLMQEFQTL